MKNAWMSVALLGAVGCSNNPVVSLESKFDGTVAAVCESCPLAFGEPTTEGCRERAPSLFTDATWDCLQDNYAMYPEALEPFWTCWNQAYDRYDRCVRDALAPCPEAGAIDSCNAEIEAANETCPRPTDTNAALGLAGCFSG